MATSTEFTHIIGNVFYDFEFDNTRFDNMDYAKLPAQRRYEGLACTGVVPQEEPEPSPGNPETPQRGSCGCNGASSSTPMAVIALLPLALALTRTRRRRRTLEPEGRTARLFATLRARPRACTLQARP